MARPHEAAKLTHEGLGPAAIANRLGISVNSVRQYLWIAVAEGLVRRSDILFNCPRPLRQAVSKALIGKKPKTVTDLRLELYREKVAFDRAELEMVWQLTVTGARYGDLYEYLTETEKMLHEQIRAVLVREFGSGEQGWWRQGIPQSVRIDCATARERDIDGDAEPFAYSTLIHLRETLDRQWPLFQAKLPKSVTKDKKAFLRNLERLNGIRNRVMHPTRLHKITDEDFEFARDMHQQLRLEAWQSRDHEIVYL